MYGACPNSPKGDHTTILDASTLYQMRRIEDIKKLNAKLVEKAWWMARMMQVINPRSRDNCALGIDEADNCPNIPKRPIFEPKA